MKKRIILIIVGVLLLFCVLCLIVSSIWSNTPEGQAAGTKSASTNTAQAMDKASTNTAQAIANVPTNTSQPTETATSTPTETLTVPADTPIPPTPELVTEEIHVCIPEQEPQVARVSNVVDGDTIDVLMNGQEYRVRYIGIDTPETVHPSKPVEFFGPEASAYNKELVDGKEVLLYKDVSALVSAKRSVSDTLSECLEP